MPFLFQEVTGGLSALQPAMLNLLAVSPTQVIAPEPHGPLIDGKDPFKTHFEEALAAYGLRVHWSDVWSPYHVGGGQVHCATNSAREVPGDEVVGGRTMRRDVYRCLGAALLLTALTAGAADAPLAGSWRALLQEQIARARKETPEAFARVDSAVSRVGLLDARKRGTLAPVSPLFRELGPDALWPMVERLAFPSEQAKGMEQDSARLALAVGLMEALGELRDARLVPLWKDLLETGADTRAPVLRAAAGALARMETLEAAQTLIAVSRQGGPRGEAAQEKLGECRRLVAARALADALAARPGPEEARRRRARSETPAPPGRGRRPGRAPAPRKAPCGAWRRRRWCARTRTTRVTYVRPCPTPCCGWTRRRQPRSSTRPGSTRTSPGWPRWTPWPSGCGTTRCTEGSGRSISMR